MKKSLLIALFTLGLSLSVSADNSDEKAFISYCSNFTSGSQAVSYSFVSCINRNFDSLSRDFNGSVFTSYCSNFGRTVDYSFTSCINRNFESMGRALNRSIFIAYCGNYNSNELSYSFVSCANSNFSRIERALSRP